MILERDVVMLLNIGLLIIGLFLVIKGADLFVDAAVKVARRTGMSEVLIGATLVSVATTLPEIAVSSYSSYLKQAELAVGNSVGSVIFNTGVILGLSTIISPTIIRDRKFSSKALFMVFSGLLLSFFALNGKVVALEGFILVVLLVVYLTYVFKTSQNETNEIQQEDTPTWVLTAKFLGGAMSVVFGSRLMVNSAVTIAEVLGVSQAIIGLTILAVGTSLPELVTSLTAIKKGHQNVSVGNIIGANFLNMTSVLGISSIINPLTINRYALKTDLPVMLVLMFLVFLFGKKGKIARWNGFVFLGIYILYFVNILLRTAI